jgi:hypothetical protein
MNEKLIEYDKRVGVPKFEGWQEREKEAYQEFCKRPGVMNMKSEARRIEAYNNVKNL